MAVKKTGKEKQEAREILKPVLKAERKLRKAAQALVVAKLALAHALVEAKVDRNPTLAAWTEGVLSGDEASVQKIFEMLTAKKNSPAATDKAPAALTVIAGGAVAAAPPVRKTTGSRSKAR